MDVAVGVVGVEDALDVAVGLGAVAVAVFGEGVAVETGFAFVAEVVVDVVVPELGIFAVFAGEADGVEDVTGTGVVGGKDELDALLGIGDVGGEVAVKVAEVGGADVEVAVGAEVVVNVEMVSSLRHDLHEAVGSESGFGVLVEMGFAIDDGCNEAPIPAEGTACLLDEAVVGGDFARFEKGVFGLVAGDDGGFDEITVVEFVEFAVAADGLEPGVDFFGEEAFAGWGSPGDGDILFEGEGVVDVGHGAGGDLGDVAVDDGVVDKPGLDKVDEVFAELLVEFDDIEADLEGVLEALQEPVIGGEGGGNADLFAVQFLGGMDEGVVAVLDKDFVSPEKGGAEGDFLAAFVGCRQPHGEEVVFALAEAGDGSVKVEVDFDDFEFDAKVPGEILGEFVVETTGGALVDVEIGGVVKGEYVERAPVQDFFEDGGFGQHEGCLFGCRMAGYVTTYNA